MRMSFRDKYDTHSTLITTAVLGSLLLMMILLVGGVIFYGRSPNNGDPKIDPAVSSISPDVKVIISSSISSVQKQSQLLVLTARMNATTTTTVKKMGMEAWQVDIASGEAQYLIDLQQINEKMVDVNGNDILITLPKNVLIVRLLPPVSIERKDNDSWLFTWYPDAREGLTRTNKLKINHSFIDQSKEQKEIAYIQARHALEMLFTIPIKASGLPHRVTVSFQ